MFHEFEQVLVDEGVVFFLEVPLKVVKDVGVQEMEDE